MSHYIEQWCEKHGDWDMDVDNPGGCPDCPNPYDVIEAQAKRIGELEEAKGFWRTIKDDPPPLDFEAVYAWNPRKDRGYIGVFEHNGWFTSPYGAFYREDFSHWMPMIGPEAKDALDGKR